MTTVQEPGFSILILIARFFLGAVFLTSAIHKTVWHAKAVEEFKKASVPIIQLSLPITVILHIVASLCILGGVFIISATLSLAVFTVVATVWVFPFWQSTGSARLEQSRIALANLGLVGGLLLLMASGPGKYVLF